MGEKEIAASVKPKDFRKHFKEMDALVNNQTSETEPKTAVSVGGKRKRFTDYLKEMDKLI